WALAAEFSLILVGMLLFSERTWKHHCVTLVLPFAVLCYFLATVPATLRLRAYLAATLAGTTLLMASTSSGLLGGKDRSRELAEQLHKLTQVYGAWALANLVFVAALVVLLRVAWRRREAGSQGEPAPSPAVTELPLRRSA